MNLPVLPMATDREQLTKDEDENEDFLSNYCNIVLRTVSLETKTIMKWWCDLPFIATAIT